MAQAQFGLNDIRPSPQQVRRHPRSDTRRAQSLQGGGPHRKVPPGLGHQCGERRACGELLMAQLGQRITLLLHLYCLL
ncbi:MAG: hypothetical protein OXH52_03035 [Gammaproteobacteria bacterium]|nr:hypothetical protein [Gammaproteobacteria bacterium]